MTSRSNVLATDPAAKDLEISRFAEDEGTQFLLNTIGRNEYVEEERDAALMLYQDLGGLPVALNLMGGQIRERRMSVKQFLKHYRDDSQKHVHRRPRNGIQNSYYGFALEEIWEKSFAPLDEESLRLLGILCVLNADDISEALFTECPSTELPEKLPFCGPENYWR
jgi:hypothetical protein